MDGRNSLWIDKNKKKNLVFQIMIHDTQEPISHGLLTIDIHFYTNRSTY